ncbi:hypothetical protein BJG93_35305 [Paraburkholderia sprentiae WSM5005]|uniref:Uncharacterized protein n=1 Tax=Paraburkholderia sprentiae WSM5005 TaxID=754502 RepID=A0A8F4QJK1_9BURK|nr:hypothetical protein [Paraburkholderia sprentiae]QXE07126.1 hypothetical protein BJG93_35305 [Paraburkholderia sprentiae WSM5005]
MEARKVTDKRRLTRARAAERLKHTTVYNTRFAHPARFPARPSDAELAVSHRAGRSPLSCAATDQATIAHGIGVT